AGIFGPSRGFEQGAARPRVFSEHSEPKRPRARHYRDLVRLPRRISATGRARSRAGGLALAEAVDDRRAPVAAKGAGRDLDADRSLAALVLVGVHHGDDAPHRVRRESTGDEVVHALVFLDVALENAVELGVGWKRVLVGLVGAQLGRRRAREYGLRDDRSAGARVHVARDVVDQHLRDVLDHGEAPGHVAVERRIAHAVLALVAG